MTSADDCEQTFRLFMVNECFIMAGLIPSVPDNLQRLIQQSMRSAFEHGFEAGRCRIRKHKAAIGVRHE